jgi:hypothetical protein
MMTPREVFRRTIRFQTPDRLGHDFCDLYENDCCGVACNPWPDARPSSGVDEWGSVWKNLGTTTLGEVQEFPLKTWDDLARLKIPDIDNPKRWEDIKDIRQRAGDKYIISTGVSLFERVHFLRGLHNMWLDIHDAPNRLRELLEILAEMNVRACKRYGELGCDGCILWDDLGLQDRLMVSPQQWRDIWKPYYARHFAACHEAGMDTFLHSCGYIVDILDDLIDIGLDVIQMDQQQNMGLELLGKRFGGRITFFSPADIQVVMQRPVDEIRAYCRRMVQVLGRREGGFLPRLYGDAKAVGHTDEARRAACEEFLKISREMYGQ